ncbi:MAG: alkaline phosphatase family protein [Candidatus Baltobacteraceae bacterium]
MRLLSIVVAMLLCCADAKAAAVPKVDRIIVIVLENQEVTSILSPSKAQSKTPRLWELAQHQRIATNYFGVTHPSEPNYISMIGGDSFGWDTDAGSCFTKKIKLSCHKTNASNVVDDFEAKNISWMALMQGMPSAGYLGGDYFFNTMYAEKHNPFIFFSNITGSPQRMSHIRPLGTPDTILPILADPKKAPQFLFIVPDLCHDMHGTPRCLDKVKLYEASDGYVSDLIRLIMSTPAFTDRSAIILTWDEGDTNGACCALSRGGGRVATIVFKKRPSAFRSQTSYNHYSLLSTIETVWGLALLGHTGDRTADGKLRFAPMLDLLSH